jgi:hypothetical protein
MKKIKVHSLTGRITPRLMRQAFQAVKRNRGAAGVDKVSIQMFAYNLEENLAALMRELKTGTFEPLPLRRVLIPKGPGSTKLRPLGIPVVRDRVAQEVLRRLLAPIFEPLFHENSYGFIPGRNCHQAIERVLELHRQGYLVVLDADIQGFFDNLSHRVIMAALAAEVADGNILTLVEGFLTAGVMEDGVFKPTTIGTPQGGVITPPTMLQKRRRFRTLSSRKLSFERRTGKDVSPVSVCSQGRATSAISARRIHHDRVVSEVQPLPACHPRVRVHSDSGSIDCNCISSLDPCHFSLRAPATTRACLRPIHYGAGPPIKGTGSLTSNARSQSACGYLCQSLRGSAGEGGHDRESA